MDYSRALISVINKCTIYIGLHTHVCVHTPAPGHLSPPAAVSKPSSVALSPVTELITLMGNAKLSSGVISLEISKKGLLELFFKDEKFVFLKGLLQKKQFSPYVFLEGRRRGQNVQAEC